MGQCLTAAGRPPQWWSRRRRLLGRKRAWATAGGREANRRRPERRPAGGLGRNRRWAGTCGCARPPPGSAAARPGGAWWLPPTTRDPRSQLVGSDAPARRLRPRTRRIGAPGQRQARWPGPVSRRTGPAIPRGPTGIRTPTRTGPHGASGPGRRPGRHVVRCTSRTTDDCRRRPAGGGWEAPRSG